MTAKKPSFLYLAGSLAGGNYVSMALNMLGGVLLGRLVMPETLGLFSSIGLILGYAPVLQLGILNGLNRELPYFIGKGDRGRAEELAAAAQAWALLVGGMVASGLLLASVWHLFRGTYQTAAGLAAYAFLALMLFYNTYYLQMIYRTSHDFARLALSKVAESVAGILLLAGVYYFGFYGLCLRAVGIAIISLAILYHWRPLRVRPKWNGKQMKHLLVIGAPIFGVGQLYAWWGLLGSTLVLKYMGAKGMGLYAIVGIASLAIGQIPSAIGQVIYPRMAEQYGRTGKIADLIRSVIKPTIYTGLGLLPLIVVAWVLVPPAVNFAVPAYAEAVPAMQWELVCAGIGGLVPINNVFNVVKRQDLYVLCIGVGMAVFWISLKCLLKSDVYLAAFPQAMVIGRVVFVILCYACVCYLYSIENGKEEKCRLTGIG